MTLALERKGLEGIQDFEIDKSQTYIIEGHYNCTEAYEKTLSCLEEVGELTAIAALSDTMAVGAAKAILKQDKQIGKDIDVIGFDGMEIAAYYNPSLTTIEQPRADIAAKGVELLLELLAKTCQHQHCILKTNLLKRK